MTVLLTEDSAVAKVAGPKAAVLLEKNKGIRTVGDLFEYLPRSYVATNTLTDMSTLREGQTVLVVAQVPPGQAIEPSLVARHEGLEGSVAIMSNRLHEREVVRRHAPLPTHRKNAPGVLRVHPRLR